MRKPVLIPMYCKTDLKRKMVRRISGSEKTRDPSCSLFHALPVLYGKSCHYHITRIAFRSRPQLCLEKEPFSLPFLDHNFSHRSVDSWVYYGLSFTVRFGYATRYRETLRAQVSASKSELDKSKRLLREATDKWARDSEQALEKQVSDGTELILQCAGWF